MTRCSNQYLRGKAGFGLCDFYRKRKWYKKVDFRYLKSWEKNANITTDVLVKICEVLDCDVSDIMEVVTDEEAQKVE